MVYPKESSKLFKIEGYIGKPFKMGTRNVGRLVRVAGYFDFNKNKFIKKKDTAYYTYRNKNHVMKKTGGSFGLSIEGVIKKLQQTEVNKIIIFYDGSRGFWQMRAVLDQFEEFVNNSPDTFLITDRTTANNDIQWHLPISEFFGIKIKKERDMWMK